MANNIKSNTSFWAEISDYKIQVPYYQRDYAQGRKDGKWNKDNYVKGRIDNIREVFVGELFGAICDKENSDATDAKTSSIELSETIPDTKKCHLGLIFGSYDDEDEKNKRFIAVDGQQRLTTVFLLHWYVAWRENKLNDYKVLSTNFSWDTRSYSSQFVKLLFKIEQSDDVIYAITTNPDYFSIWESDPTVKGMLTMLKEIEDQYPKRECGLCSKLFSKNCNIRYDILKLEKDSDEKTYLKMNSRGRSLTTFELFKSEFIDDFKPGYAEKFDNNWLKFMLEMSKTEDGFKDPDICYMNFINEYTYFQLRKGLAKEKKEDYKLFINAKLKGNLLDIPFISFKKYKPAFENKLEEFEKFFDWIVDNYDSIREIDGEIRFNNDKFFLDSIIKVKDNNPYYSDRAKFFAAFVYAHLTGFAPVDKPLYLKWARVFRNLIENTDINDENFGNICKAIYGINNPDIYIYLLNNSIGAFDSNQVKEEIDKAKQIFNRTPRTDGITWEDAIKEAETTYFFRGTIRFLFTDEHGKVNDESWDKFNIKWGNAQNYFDDEELQEVRILQCFISCCNNIEQMKKIVYDSKSTTWKSNLLNVNLLKVTNDFLLNPIPEILKCGIVEDGKPKEIQEDLVLTNLLYNIKYNNWPVYGCELRDKYGQYALLPNNAKSDQKKYVVANKRNEILSSLIISNMVLSNQKLEDCDFFYGWDIKFIYRGRNFQWYRNDIIYIMKDEDPTDGFMYKDKNAIEETQKYYCFSASNFDISNTADFTQSLDNLIAQAYPDESDKNCCDDCQTK